MRHLGMTNPVGRVSHRCLIEKNYVNQIDLPLVSPGNLICEIFLGM